MSLTISNRKKLPADPLARLNSLYQLLDLGGPHIAIRDEPRYHASLSLPPTIIRRLKKKDTLRLLEKLGRGKRRGERLRAKSEVARLGCAVLESLLMVGEGEKEGHGVKRAREAEEDDLREGEGEGWVPHKKKRARLVAVKVEEIDSSEVEVKEEEEQV
ncbi:hypothetical protein LTR37_008992 [Vermiconidia calcicola]|uniref:Uncharacterized protein n=1 Tax=Vermiconidia calcicola TaxID=1690605 RepID=A0ACC3N977_9PEZI|nr:hypothetical protein LTR37_008992 [Vermiconidia calcicola]